MGKTLAQLDAEMGAGELVTWEVFEDEYQLPDLFFATAQICTTIVRSFAGGSPKWGDFAHIFKPPPRMQSGRDMANIIRTAQLAASQKAKPK